MSDTARRAEPTKSSVTVADAERAVERYRRTRSENAELREEVAALAVEKAALSDEIRTFEQVLNDTRAGLTAAPKSGDEWDGTLAYMTGDDVMRKGDAYVSLRLSRNKPPEENILYWAVVVAPSYPHWDTLSGFIEKGTRCTYPDGDGKETVWECQLAHNKFSTFKPKDGSEQWERVPT